MNGSILICKFLVLNFHIIFLACFIQVQYFDFLLLQVDGELTVQ